MLVVFLCFTKTLPLTFSSVCLFPAVDLVSKLIVFDPAKRLTASEALSHNYFTQLHSTGSMMSCTPSESMRFHIEDELRHPTANPGAILRQIREEAELFVPAVSALSSEADLDIDSESEACDDSMEGHLDTFFASKLSLHCLQSNSAQSGKPTRIDRECFTS